MDQSQAPPVSCLKVRPISSKERKWLQKEELRLTRHFIVGTMTREDKKRLAEVKELLSAS
jgi:hypothetical protein